MDEEPNENELEERLYAMIHHVDQTQANANTANESNEPNVLENTQRSNIRRYWQTGDQPAPFQKINPPKETAPIPTNKNTTNVNNKNSKPKKEKCKEPEVATIDLSLFQSPPQFVKKTIEILDHEVKSVVLESSDEDEVIEVELPPKPTITIESSDEDEVCIVSKKIKNPLKDQNHPITISDDIASANGERDHSASPVASVVSSVSDDFIRNDCIALNISSKRPDNHSFDFSLHGSDLLEHVTPSKKKKKKKSKEAVTSTPIVATPQKVLNAASDICFATPKSKAKNKKQKNKSYAVTEKSVPSADIYDSDSNQSVIETNKAQSGYTVTEKSLPCADVYESDSSQPESNKDVEKITTTVDVHTVDKSESNISGKQGESSADAIVDLTDSDYVTLDSTGIAENIIMANVTGFKESEDYEDEPVKHPDTPKLGSTKVPQILFENLDFDNLKGNDKVCKRRRYSLTTLRAEMEKFYNESWGGEDFNHREIQKYMSRDKSLWVIDPKDRMPSLAKRKVTCNYCNRPGHRDDTCRFKPPVCYMCGSTGHYEPRCPSKICVNCGSPNHMYSTMCHNCMTWARVVCAECGQPGHPASHCPDLWRRYHNTIDNNMPLAENRQTKKSHQQHCSGCARRGHLVHACRAALPFSGLPLHSPYVARYRPLHPPTPHGHTLPSAPLKKRHSKSPINHEQVKKRHLSITEDPKERQRKNSQGKDDKKTQEVQQVAPEKPPECIPVSSNRDKKGEIIQDNEVSNTSDISTTARIYVTGDVIEKIKTDEGAAWLQEAMKVFNVVVQSADASLFLTIKGKVADQEAFQAELRDWTKDRSDKENTIVDGAGDGPHKETSEAEAHFHNIPKKRCDVLRKISKALESLNSDIGDPTDIYREINFLQRNHTHLLQQKVISPQKVSNNRNSLNRELKKLNMVLLGQAGLAGGPKHLHELQLLHEKLTSIRNKNISDSLRNEIGRHFHTIFTSAPRNDYAELLRMYVAKMSQKKAVRGLKKKKPPMKNKGFSPFQTVSSSPMPMPGRNDKMNMSRPAQNNVAMKFPMQTSHSDTHQPMIGKLTFYHNRVLQSRPVGKSLKKEKTRLARKLYEQIMIYKHERSFQNVKKMKKIQQQAHFFLQNL